MFKKIIGFDTETVKKKDIHTFFCFTAYSEDIKLNYYSENIDELKYVFSKQNENSYIFAHNLEFDFGIIRKWLEEHFSIEMRYAKSRLIAIILRRKSDKNKKQKRLFTMLDSMNFYPMALKKVGKIINLPKLDRPDYLGKRDYKTRKEMIYFMQYAMRDSIIVYKAMKQLQDVVEGNLGITLASTSLKYFKKNFFDFTAKGSKWKAPLWINTNVRNSYFGGRVESFYRGHVSSKNFGKIRVYDFNSLYPSVMKLDMPDITELPSIKKGAFDNEALGSALVDVKINCEYPILAERTDKLRFPCGKLSGWFTIPELNELEKLGEGKILKVHKSYNWKRTESPFIPYIDYFYNMRQKMKKEKNPVESNYKLMMNALYGKWGEVLEPTTIKTANNWKDLADSTEILHEGDYALYKGKKRFTNHTFFPIASTITAYARLKLHDYIHKTVEQRGKEIFYCDTDSLFTDAKLSTSDRLGDLKFEYQKEWFIFIRAKAYLSEDIVKLKGSNRGLQPQDIVSDMKKNQDIAVPQTRFVRLREGMRRKEKVHLQEEFRNKMFSTESDGKRKYFRNLGAKKLLNTFSPSVPINYKNLSIT